jgi:hypothetical protein
VNHAFATSDLVERATNNTVNAATFIYSDGSDANLTFTITVNPKTDDLWFRLSGPSQYSWIAVGTGTDMAGSTMFLAYEAEKSGGVLTTCKGDQSNDNG